MPRAVPTTGLRRAVHRYGIRSLLRSDTTAGLTVAAMLIPQAMAYAELGGLDPAIGLRVALVTIPVYGLLGSSRFLGVGPEPGTAVLAASIVAPIAASDPTRPAELMATLALCVGVLGVAASLLRLGVLAELLSAPVLIGYVTGVAITLVVSQLAPLTGTSFSASSVPERLLEIVDGSFTPELAATAVGAGVTATILVLRDRAPQVPGALLALGGAAGVVAVFDLDVARVGPVDGAFPVPGFPPIEADTLRTVLPGAVGVLLIGFTDNVLTARAVETDQRVALDADAEMRALGAMNIAAGLSGGFVASSSASRSATPALLGARSQVSALISWVAVVLVLLLGRDALTVIPIPALAGVVMAAGIGLLAPSSFRRLARQDNAELALALGTGGLAVVAGLLIGVGAAVLASMVLVMTRLGRPHDDFLVWSDDPPGWVSAAHGGTPDARILVFRFDAPLFFANARLYERRLRSHLEATSATEDGVVLDFEGIGSIDITASDHLDTLVLALRSEGLSVRVARANDAVRRAFERSGLQETIGATHLHPTIADAVAAARRER